MIDEITTIRHVHTLWSIGDLGFPKTSYYRMLAMLFWMKSLGRSSVEVGEPLTEQLRAIGFEPADIDFVAMSHSHFDHVGEANAFSASTWLVQEAERDWVLDESLEAENVDPDLLERLRKADTVAINGQHDVFGDGRIMILSAPGEVYADPSRLEYKNLRPDITITAMG